MSGLGFTLAPAPPTITRNPSSGYTAPAWSTVGPVSSGGNSAPSTGGGGIFQNVSNWIGLGLQTYAGVEQIRRGGGAVQQIPNAAEILAAQRAAAQAEADRAGAGLSLTDDGAKAKLNIPPIILYGVGAILLVKLLGGKK